MKVSDIIIYIMKIMWRDLKKKSFESFQRYKKSAKSPNSEWSKTGGEKMGLFLRSQERKYTKNS